LKEIAYAIKHLFIIFSIGGIIITPNEEEIIINTIEMEDAVNKLTNKEYGIHCLVIYPDLTTLREFYSYYIQKNIEEKNEVVQIASFYETEGAVRQTLSKGHMAITDVEKFENENTLVIVDSHKKYLHCKNVKSTFNANKRLVEYSKTIRKKGVSVLGDIGAFLFENRIQDLIKYELFLPKKFVNMNLKGICLYHKNDFDRLTIEQKQKLATHHGMAMEIELCC
jgi:MEDS: MEthanogen/methylotroph, DcmR Sensory domain